MLTLLIGNQNSSHKNQNTCEKNILLFFIILFFTTLAWEISQTYTRMSEHHCKTKRHNILK